MTKIEMQKLNEKLAIKFLGIKKVYYGEWDEDKVSPMYIPSGKPWKTHQIDAVLMPRFTNSLDACFNWLVSKLQEKSEVVSLIAYEHSGYCCLITHMLADEPHSEGKDESNPALALCLAIEKLIDKEDV